jgi:predicted outer membrane protein
MNQYETAPDTCPSKQDLIRVIGVWNVFQFQAATIARERSRRPEIRHFAERVWLDHAVATERLLSAAGYALVPTSLDKLHEVLLQELLAASDDGFDPLYITQQQNAAATASAVLDQYAVEGDDQDLQNFCREMREQVVLHGDIIARLTST